MSYKGVCVCAHTDINVHACMHVCVHVCVLSTVFFLSPILLKKNTQTIFLSPVLGFMSWIHTGCLDGFFFQFEFLYRAVIKVYGFCL